MRILVTGGAGYIGSHIVHTLLDAGHSVEIVDDLSRSDQINLECLMGAYSDRLIFSRIDLVDEYRLLDVFDRFHPELVIHAAGYKSVSESVAEPMLYFKKNVSVLCAVLNVMSQKNVTKLIFSSSATVYGDAQTIPIKETTPINPLNPYGTSKYACEMLLRGWVESCQSNKALIFRYFNPAGASSDLLVGEPVTDSPPNLFPALLKTVTDDDVAVFKIFGNDYPTPDGTCIRDFVHVSDLAAAHNLAVDAMDDVCRFEVINLGSGTGFSVLEVVESLSEVIQREIAYTFECRRQGDSPASFTDNSKAHEVLGWSPKFKLNDICDTAFRWSIKRQKIAFKELYFDS